MSDTLQVSPLLDGFQIGDAFHTHVGVQCYPAMKDDEKYIIKKISVPASPAQLEAMVLTGAYASIQEALPYFADICKGMEQEIELLDKLGTLEGFVPFDGHQTVVREDGNGFEIYLVSKYRPTLERKMSKEPMTHLAAVNLGLDLCSAATVSRRCGYLCVSISPDNIYVTENGDYRLGDLGFLSLDTLKYAALPEMHRSAYTAPEARDASCRLHESMDVYAIGLILYRIYNGGRLPFEGNQAPAEDFPAPLYADRDMTEILQKACAVNPDMRWKSPAEMGQALVQYMQRNEVNDTPIAAAPAEEPAEEIADLPLAESSTLAPEDAEEEKADTYEGVEFLSEAQEEEAQEIAYDEVSDDVQEILNQADDLATAEVPEGAVVPEIGEIEIPVPDAEENSEENESAPAEDVGDEPTRAVVIQPSEDALAEEETGETAQEEDTGEAAGESDEEKAPDSGRKKHTLAAILIGLLAVLIIAAGAFLYRYYYLQSVDSLTLEGEGTTLTVYIDTQVDDSMLTAICTDTYGNRIQSAVANGRAYFGNLSSGTAYNVTLSIDGFHKLYGEISGTYSTPEETRIVQFAAVAGAADGTAIVSFTVDGPDCESWTITYTDAEGNTQSQIVTDHLLNLSGLTIGTNYTFTLQPEADLYVTGTTETSFTACTLVYPDGLRVEKLEGNALTVSWLPARTGNVENWVAVCSDGEAYTESVTVTESTASFTLPEGKNFTVEVSASNMSVSSKIDIDTGAPILSDINVSVDGSKTLNAAWSVSGTVPDDNLQVTYTVDGFSSSEGLTVNGNAAVIANPVPGGRYCIWVCQSDGTPLTGSPIVAEISTQGTFSYTVGSYTLSAENITFTTCKTPGKANWAEKDVTGYTTEFAVGDKVSLVGKTESQYGVTKNATVIHYVIRDAAGNIAALGSETRAWSAVFRKGVCCLNVPSMPTQAGSYTLDIYFNGAFVNRQSITIA